VKRKSLKLLRPHSLRSMKRSKARLVTQLLRLVLLAQFALSAKKKATRYFTQLILEILKLIFTRKKELQMHLLKFTELLTLLKRRESKQLEVSSA